MSHKATLPNTSNPIFEASQNITKCLVRLDIANIGKVVNLLSS